MPSFDVVSKLNWAEVVNALNQAEKELTQRFDFKGTGARIERTGDDFMIYANADERAKAAYAIFQDKLARRKVSLKYFEAGTPEPGPKGGRKLLVKSKEGIDKEHAKKLVAAVKDTKVKVQAAIVEDMVRVTGKKKDELQAVISALKALEFDVELQFVNFRD